MITFRKATIDDCEQYYDWANDIAVREQSFKSHFIDFDSHVKWFAAKIDDPLFTFLLFSNENYEKIGQVRFQREEDNIAVIGVSIGNEQRGKGYASIILKMASDFFLNENPSYNVKAYIKNTNQASIQSFSKAGFIFSEKLVFQGFDSVIYIKTVNQLK